MDLDVIRDTLDRRQSLMLFQALRDESDASRRSEIADVLAWLNDPRLARPLADMMIDQSNPDALRRAASQILRDMTNSPEPDHDDIENLWNSGDLILKRHALGFMTWRHETLFGSVLDDPQHPLYPELISELGFAFPFPRFSEALVAALSDPRAAVRYLAAESLAWTVPAIALDPLIGALKDPDLDVRLRAIETLQYYPSEKGRTALQACTQHDDLVLAANAALVQLDELCDPNVAFEEPGQADNLPGSGHTGRPDWLRSGAAFIKRFGNTDACWAPLIADMADINWNDVSRFARDEIGDFLLSCPDVLVREHAANALTSWGDQRAKNLLDDSYFVVAKATGFAARDMKPSLDLTDQLWTKLKSASGIHATELLESFVILSAHSDWQAKCVSIALDQYWEEEVRNTAIQYLFDDFSETGKGADKLEAIANKVMCDPPVCSWALHLTILERVLDGPAIRLPDLAHLKEVDHSVLQTKIAGIAL